MRTNLGLLSMLFSDTWLLYRAARGDGLDLNSQEFFELLAAELIDTDLQERPHMTRTAPAPASTSVPVEQSKFHHPTKQHRTGKPGHMKQNNCCLCKKSTTYICLLCSKPQGKELFVCPPHTRRECWDQHFQDHHCHVHP